MATGLECQREQERDRGGDDATRTAAIDFAATWERLADTGALDCWTPDEDRAYWREHADSYGERFPDGSCSSPEPEALETIRSAVSEDDSVLELGPGTGRYTVEIAPLVDRVTAVDYSQAMLDQLRERLEVADITNVDTVSGRWPTVDVAPHDVVVTAWTMYSQREVARALEALVTATRKTLVVVDGLGAVPPHSRHLAEIRGEERTGQASRVLLLAGVLEELDVHADYSVEPAVREHIDVSPEAIARGLVGSDADDATVTELVARLEPDLERVEREEQTYETSDDGTSTDDRWRYRYEIPAGILCWHRPELETEHTR
ncbi:class I SAM-dependent methyltransferase [Natronoglomus mannanivorans]|uniref:Class I SAM-dependent methyltransferase n=1 Tax=Natronoglomus mannanivorans TaxID=2979990 RepID=A0AAP2YYD7_9EURY|nr:class I SAM-dependent methyltransferase [Halobacteria archaeon AArc-xg1-1]